MPQPPKDHLFAFADTFMKKFLLPFIFLIAFDSVFAQRPVLFGDMNHDGYITVEDLTILANILLEKQQPEIIKGNFWLDQQIDDTTPYITFHSELEQTFSMDWDIPTLEYSLGGSAWQRIGTQTVSFGKNNGDLRLRGKSSWGTAKACDDNDESWSTIIFGTDAKVECSGDIRTLVDYEQYSTVDCSNARFCHLFSECKTLASAPSLPSLVLADDCYCSMFYNCTSLVLAPELPAEKLADYCYEYMFSGCTSLKSAPELPATVLADYCYSHMFSGCTSLKSAPELPATTLADYCYNFMFSGCASINETPRLNAEILKKECYRAMFYYCSSLSKVTMMASDINADNCLYSWLSHVSSTGSFFMSDSAQWNVNGVIPLGWEVTKVNIKKTIAEHFGHEYVDLGLTSNTLWATCNIGAESPEDPGQYFSWGSIKGYYLYENHWFDWVTYELGLGRDDCLLKYTDLDNVGGGDNKTALELEDDAANKNWRGHWHIPSKEDFKELLAECSWIWNDTRMGYEVVGKNNNSIFLPISGVIFGYNRSHEMYGYYWTSERDSSLQLKAKCLGFSQSSKGSYLGYRYCGQPIRPICILE